LQNWAESLFNDIANKDLVKPYWEQPIYNDKELGTLTVVSPETNIRNLYVGFLLKDSIENRMVNIFVNYLHNFEINVYIIN